MAIFTILAAVFHVFFYAVVAESIMAVVCFSDHGNCINTLNVFPAKNVKKLR